MHTTKIISLIQHYLFTTNQLGEHVVLITVRDNDCN
jgi:hypothetical protein